MNLDQILYQAEEDVGRKCYRDEDFAEGGDAVAVAVAVAVASGGGRMMMPVDDVDAAVTCMCRR